jgi:outer membrane protein assembly factor BamB
VVIGPDSTLYFPVSYELVEKRQQAFLYASRLDGTIKWKFPLQQPPYPAGIDSQPLVGADGTIYIGAPNGNFYAVNPEGTLRWKYKADAGIYMPGINIGLDGALYFVADDKMLYAVNPDGTLRWRLSVQGGFKGTGSGIAFSTTGQTLYVPGESEFGSAEQTKFYAVNLDGGIEWEFLAGGEIHAVPMVDSDDNIYVAATSQGALHSWLYSLTPDGQIRWKIEFQGSAVNDPTIDGNGNIYVDMQTSLISIDYFGKVRWVVPVAGITTSLVCDSGNRIFGFAGGIFSIDPAGELLWKTEVPTLARVSPAIDAMGTLYIGTWLVGSSLDKRLYAVGQK